MGQEIKRLAPALKDTKVTSEACILYSHDNEHQRYLDQPGVAAGDTEHAPQATHTPFADLAALLRKDGQDVS